MARGGKREGAGRPRGAVNRATKDIREAAQEYTDEALGVLASVMRDAGQAGAARVSAAQALLDRAHGKPAQAVKVGGDEDGVPIRQELSWAHSPNEATPDPSSGS